MLNMDFTRRVAIPAAQQHWQPSPALGVWRRRFAFEEAERGHATSLVRFDPGSSFRRHDHPLGEEILVLDGVFSDHSGDFPAGSYLRNPEGFAHAPRSEPGCTLFVKLHQFAPHDTARVCIDSHRADWQCDGSGIETLPLHRFGGEHTALIRCPAGAVLPLPGPGGAELLVVSGSLRGDGDELPAGSWLRDPQPAADGLRAVDEVVALVKRGHLPGVDG